MNDPITTTITNMTNSAFAVRWTAKGPVWLEANGQTTVPYEPWSCADREQRQLLLAACSSKRVKLTMHVADADGVIHDLDYDPSSMLHPKETPVEEYKPLVKKPDTEIKADVDHDHVIVTGDNDVAANLGFQSKTVTPPESKIKDTDPHVGSFVVQKSEASGVTTTDVLEEKTAAEVLAGDETKDAFNKAVAEKRWDDALQVLVDKFGADKVTFTTRVIMAMKDYDAVVAKYKLA